MVTTSPDLAASESNQRRVDWTDVAKVSGETVTFGRKNGKRDTTHRRIALRVAPPGFEPGLPHPERRPQGAKNRQNDRKWRPDEHRRPVGLKPVPAGDRRNACKMLAESSGRLSL